MRCTEFSDDIYASPSQRLHMPVDCPEVLEDQLGLLLAMTDKNRNDFAGSERLSRRYRNYERLGLGDGSVMPRRVGQCQTLAC